MNIAKKVVEKVVAAKAVAETNWGAITPIVPEKGSSTSGGGALVAAAVLSTSPTIAELQKLAVSFGDKGQAKFMTALLRRDGGIHPQVLAGALKAVGFKCNGKGNFYGRVKAHRNGIDNNATGPGGAYAKMELIVLQNGNWKVEVVK